MKKEINISINITLSKVMAFLMLVLAFIIDLLSDKAGTVFMFAIPFVAAMIANKQYNDRKAGESLNSDNESKAVA